MKVPVIEGVIDRRVLVNYRIAPEILARQLPPPFRPKLCRGFGVGGICLIRLTKIRPAGFPAWTGFSSENAAHRIAVEWDEGGKVLEGVYIPRRDTDNCLNTLAGGRLFPGLHHHAAFRCEEGDERYAISIESDDGQVKLDIEGRVAAELPRSELFEDLAEASSFFERGSLGYSATKAEGAYEGLELRCRSWKVEALETQRAHSSFFEDASRFPSGSVTFDHALLMRGIEHEWHAQEPLCVSCQA